MINLTDRDILDIIDTAEQAGHKDPIGLLARSEVLTKLNPEFSNATRFGLTGVRLTEAQRLGIENAGELVNNLSAAIQIDLDNYTNYENVGDMHVAFYGGGKAVKNRSERPKKFMRQLQNAKRQWNARVSKLRNKKIENVSVLNQPSVPQIALENTATQSDDPQSLTLSRVVEQERDGDSRQISQMIGMGQRETTTVPKPRLNSDRSSLRKMLKEIVANV